MKIIAISGSLRKASTNTGLLREAIKLAPQGMSIQYYPIQDFPMYNDDLIVNNVKPTCILKAYLDFAQADAFLFGAPCYNHSVSSPLKNCIDWISRDESPLRGKPMGYFHSGKNPKNYIESALQVSVEWLKMPVYTEKSVFVLAPGNFDLEGNLTNQDVRKQIHDYLNGFKKYIQTHKKAWFDTW